MADTDTCGCDPMYHEWGVHRPGYIDPEEGPCDT